MTTRKRDAFNVAFHFYECPICHETGSIGFRTDADEDQVMHMQCEHQIPITIEGRIAREQRLAAAPQPSRGDGPARARGGAG